MELLPNTKSMIQRKWEAAKAIARYGFENFPTSDFGKSDHIPFEDDVEVMPPYSEDPVFWYDVGGYPHPLIDDTTYYVGESGKKHPTVSDEK